MKNELKIITKDWDKLNPLRIEDYIAIGGYQSLEKFISKLKPSEIIAEIKESQLAGRGGAGFLMGEKLAQVAEEKGTKYFICNLDESEPGTYKDRAIVDHNPHLLLEGIILCSLAIGAEKAFIYLNGRYEEQREILAQAIQQARKKYFLGKNIFQSDYKLSIELFSGAGAYICGEETALINSLEGNRGEPKLKPPYPVKAGLFGCPTVINNAETIANIPWIIKNSGEKYKEIGSISSPGSKLFILGGVVKNKGLIEAQTGITLRELIYDFGGGLPSGKEFWFAQLGGSSGRLLLEDELDIKLDFNKKNQYPLGSGSVLVVDKTVDIYDLMLSWASFFRRESCGKCVPCREGTFRLWGIIKRLRDGEISQRDKEAMEDILWTLNNTTFCPLGKFSATAIQDAITKLGKDIFKKNN